MRCIGGLLSVVALGVGCGSPPGAASSTSTSSSGGGAAASGTTGPSAATSSAATSASGATSSGSVVGSTGSGTISGGTSGGTGSSGASGASDGGALDAGPAPTPFIDGGVVVQECLGPAGTYEYWFVLPVINPGPSATFRIDVTASYASGDPTRRSLASLGPYQVGAGASLEVREHTGDVQPEYWQLYGDVELQQTSGAAYQSVQSVYLPLTDNCAF